MHMHPVKLPPLSHYEPWNISFSERLAAFKNVKCQRKRVVYLYEYPDSSTFRYRAYNMCQALDSSTSWHGSYFFESELPHLKPILNEIDLIVLVRMRWSFTLAEFIDLATKKNLKLIFDCDDLVFDLDSALLILHTLSQEENNERLDYMFAYVSRMHQTAKQCCATLGTNPFLCNHLTRVFNTPSFSIPNFMNREQIEISNSCSDAYGNKDRFLLGYFSGTSTHYFDFESISDEIFEFLSAYPDSELHLTGYIETPDSLKILERKGRIRRLPFVNFLELQKLISTVDVNLAPLQMNQFTNCKSELKFFEAAAVAVPTCASPTVVFKNAIQDSVTGFICDQGSWFNALKQLRDEKFNRQIGQAAREYCLFNYSPQSLCSKIESALDLCVSKSVKNGKNS